MREVTAMGSDDRGDYEDAMHWLDRELREARQALWKGQPVKAFASVEAAQDELEKLQEADDAE